MELVETVSVPVPASETTLPAQKSFAQGLTLYLAYSGFYLATLCGALAPLPVAANLVFAVANGIFMAMLFVLGHDCCHGALMPGPRWNAWLGRIAFVPILHSTSLWRIAHNQHHHGRPNLKGVDPVWAPMSLTEYRQASRWRRFVERVYRGGWGALFYHHTALWLPSLLLPLGGTARLQWQRHLKEALFVVCGGAMLFAAILFGGHALAPERTLWTVALLGIAVPYLSWGYFMALSTYLNHTHPSVPWFADERSWQAHDPALRTSIHLKLPINFLPLYSDVMTHTAHHVDASTPVFALPEAQARLKAAHGDAVIEYTFGIDAYRRIVRACKLFDFERMCWTDFDGNPTSPKLI